jgi:hypothetical protein
MNLTRLQILDCVPGLGFGCRCLPPPPPFPNLLYKIQETNITKQEVFMNLFLHLLQDCAGKCWKFWLQRGSPPSTGIQGWWQNFYGMHAVGLRSSAIFTPKYVSLAFSSIT